MQTPYIKPETVILSIQTESPLLTLSSTVPVDTGTQGDQSEAEIKAEPFDFSWE